MKKKKWWLIEVAVIILSLGIGGKFYMDKREEEKKKEQIKVERMASLALKNTFENVEKIEFDENQGKNSMTGSYRFILTITNMQKETCSFDIIYVAGEKKLENYGVEDRNVQKKGSTLESVNVIYSNGEEDVL
ncbi:hypothetical protein [Enterococcus rivorum]|uniref:DUF1310 domain-containing protein n=1 Tax=Enterococcus rivorum TaxID=762845 RepID=A0A1E5KW78_9ENTE|nr:hypothetical protein [Enterococcus rivorum]MBP2100080.1 hypothetical protein [Enterococcus rivorum]OEH82124.1 hypothetical protein BCR26_14405 [Enterococcus rivorum]